MKKTLMMLAIVACVVQAQAANYTFAIQLKAGYKDGQNMQPITEDEFGDSGKYYSAYSMSLANAKIATGLDLVAGDTASKAIETWLGENYWANSVTWKTATGVNSATGATLVNSDTGVAGNKDFYVAFAEQYATMDDAASDNNYYVVFYNDGKGDIAYRVGRKYDVLSVQREAIKDVVIAGVTVAGKGTATTLSWNSVAVPEPTSGMLMLLGLAGLCLRRKQRG